MVILIYHSTNSSAGYNAGTDLQSEIEGWGVEGVEWTGIKNPYIPGANGQIRDANPDVGAFENTQGSQNNPPNQPSNPNPANGAINQPTTLTLTWNCSDPNGDPLTYDVYFGTSSNPPLVSGNQTGTSYNPGQLNNSTTYYWKIVAKDNQGGTTTGPVWSFTTQVNGGSGGDNIPPELTGVQSVQTNQVVLDFSEPLDSVSASNPENYSISGQVQILDASLNLSHQRITLTTNQQIVNHIYTVQISNVNRYSGKCDFFSGQFNILQTA